MKILLLQNYTSLYREADIIIFLTKANGWVSSTSWVGTSAGVVFALEFDVHAKRVVVLAVSNLEGAGDEGVGFFNSLDVVRSVVEVWVFSAQEGNLDFSFVTVSWCSGWQDMAAAWFSVTGVDAQNSILSDDDEGHGWVSSFFKEFSLFFEKVVRNVRQLIHSVEIHKWESGFDSISNFSVEGVIDIPFSLRVKVEVWMASLTEKSLTLSGVRCGLSAKQKDINPRKIATRESVFILVQRSS
jgi:hypothetical protein